MREWRAAHQALERGGGGRIGRLRSLFICQAVLTSGLSLSFPFLALYLHRERGLGMGWVGAVLGLNVVFASVAQALGGELSDIAGRQRVMRDSLSLRAAAVGVLAYAVWRRWPFAPLVSLLFLSTLIGNFFEPAARGWVADHCPPSQRSRGYGLLRIAVNLGWVVGPAVGGTLAQSSYALLFAATAATCGLCSGLVAWTIDNVPGERGEERFAFSGVLQARKNPRFLRVCGLSLALGVVMAQLVVSLSIHATQFVGLTDAQVGWLFSLNGLIVVLIQVPATRWWSQFPLTTALAAGSLFYAAGYAWVGTAPTLVAMSAAIVVVTLGETTVAPALQSLWANLAPPREKGRYVGFAGLVFQMGHALGPLLGGLALQYLSPVHPSMPWLGVALVAAAAGGGFYAIGGRFSSSEQGLDPAAAPVPEMNF